MTAKVIRGARCTAGGSGAAIEPAIEATLHKRLDGSRWRAFVKPAKKLAVGDVLRFGDRRQSLLPWPTRCSSFEHKDEGGEVTLSFAFHGPVLDQAIAERGDMPLPPYIASRRAPDEQDRTDYQTLFAREEGSVAAPTAGLHFTDRAAGAAQGRAASALHKVTLHVGAGTFLPVKADDTAGHKMHAEFGSVSCGNGRARSMRRAPKADASLRSGRPRFGFWKARLATTAGCTPFPARPRSSSRPAIRFRAVDLMLTNFHLPRSTLFMLVAAFSGLDTMKRAYAHAIAAGYRFYSYGDACLLYPQHMSVIMPAMRREPTSLKPAATRRGWPGQARAMTRIDVPTVLLHLIRRARAGRIRDAARQSADAGLHAGRHAGDGERT